MGKWQAYKTTPLDMFIAQVGADVTVSVVNATKAPAIMAYMLANVSGIQNASLQYQLSQSYLNTVIKTIDPDSWSVSAYYENGLV